MDLSTLSVTDLNLMTKDQIISVLTEGQADTKTIVSTGDRRGQLREVRETRDLAGNLLSTQETDWTYYENGNVDTITMIDKDAKGITTNKRVIKHKKSGGLAVILGREISYGIRTAGF